MKRDPALQPLSHDHHQALFIAQRLRRADEENVAEVAGAFLEFWREHGQRHFRDEEEILLPAYAEYGDVTDPLIARVLTDHVIIRNRAQRLASALGEATDGAAAGASASASATAADAADPAALQELGELLADHVRREERELFPQIEQALPEDAIAKLGETFTSSEEARSRSGIDAST